MMQAALSAARPRRRLRSAARASCVAGVLVSTFFCPSVAPAQATEDRQVGEVPAAITGTIFVRGCRPLPSDVDLRAQSVAISGPFDSRPSDSGTADPRARAVEARIEETSEPHMLRFSIRGLRPSTVYHLTIAQVPDSTCSTIFWRGPFGGFAVSGGPPVRIEGVAATTELEVFDPRSDGWVGLDGFDDATVDEVRLLRWRTTVPGAVGGELQVSTARFPNDGDFEACDEPERGVTYRQSVSIGEDGWSEIEGVSLGQIFRRLQDLPEGELPSIGRTVLRAIDLGSPIYLRVVPVTADGPACDTTEQGVPSWVLFAKAITDTEPETPPDGGPILEPGANHEYKPPYLGVGGHPTYGENAYKILESHKLGSLDFCLKVKDTSLPYDPLGCLFVISGYVPENTVLLKDKWYIFKYTPSGGGGGNLLDVPTAFVTGGVGALGVGVNAIADIWNGAVAGAKSLAYDVLLQTPIVGPICSSSDDMKEKCKTGINAGVTIGLASMGLPPSLPNWDELKDDGVDYLASMIADGIEEETGIPHAVTVAGYEFGVKLLTKTAIDRMTAARGGSNPTFNWAMEYLGFDPASTVVAIRKNGIDPLPPGMVLKVTSIGLYSPRKVALPRRFLAPLGSTSTTLRIPVVLNPDLSSIQAPFCLTDRVWRTTCTLPSFLKGCWYEASWSPEGPDIKERKLGCTSVNYDEIYYRDNWTAWFNSTNCVTLFAHTYQKLFLQPPVALPGLFTGTVAALRPWASWGWSGFVTDNCSQ